MYRDNIWKPDKSEMLHFIIACAIVVATYIIGGTCEFKYAFIGFCMSVLVSICEDLFNKYAIRNYFNWRDVAFQLFGSFFGIVICTLIFVNYDR